MDFCKKIKLFCRLDKKREAVWASPFVTPTGFKPVTS